MVVVGAGAAAAAAAVGVVGVVQCNKVYIRIHGMNSAFVGSPRERLNRTQSAVITQESSSQESEGM